MGKKVNIGVIGAGSIGSVHTEAYGRIADVANVVALCDILPDKLAEKAKRHSIGKTAAAGEDSAEVGGVVEDAFVEGGDVYVAAVEERLEFFKSHSRVDVWLHGVLLDFEFLGGAWAYEDYAAGAFVFFDVF